VETTNGASCAARGSTGTLAAHGGMARVKSAVVGEGIPAEEEAASTPSSADNPRKMLSA
jgi:hypothetical protein